MPFRFHKSLKLLPGLKINFSKTGASLSLGGKGLSLNLGRKGTRSTIGLPGSGLSYSDTNTYRNLEQNISPDQDNAPASGSSRPFPWFLVLVIILLILAAFSGMFGK